MPLWTAAMLFIAFGAGILAVILLARRRGKKRWLIAAAAGASILLLALMAYILLTLVFIDTAQNNPSGALPGDNATAIAASTPTAAPATSAPQPNEYDLPAGDIPALCPDILELRSIPYEEMPTLATQNEVTKYVLHNFLNNRFAFGFYLTKDIASDESTGFSILNRACETAMTYYLFSAYEEVDMFTEDRGDEGKVYAKITIAYTEAERDLEARAEALEFVMKNPVPAGEFKDFESEKAYARKIHDFIAKKTTYSPIGYAPESMFGMKKYEALQEAYNVLAEEEHAAVCAGYARAFALIAQYAGINAAWVFGNETETESHSWNVIYPCDGSEAVLVDVTWDDTASDDTPDQAYVSDRYFYIPLSQEEEHTAAVYFDEFLKFVNKQ